jgi:hypothetical protein
MFWRAIDVSVFLRRVIRAIDNMIKILEIHTQQLEATAIQRSTEIYEQKKKAEELLYNILPR